MKASENWLSKLLQIKAQYTIPVYQRPFSWSRSQCAKLWDDLVEVSRQDQRSHFLGSVVYIRGSGPTAKVDRHLVIDGQQRLTTVTLLLLALRDHLRKYGDRPDVAHEEINVDYLYNGFAKGDDRYKLVLTDVDKQTLLSLVDGTPRPQSFSTRIDDAYRFFHDRLESSPASADFVFAGLMKLSVVEVVLDPKEDDAQLIFESLNSTGLALSQADLIRNFVLMQADRDQQDFLYTNYWRVMEDRFGQANYAKYFNAYMRHYLTLRLNRIPKIDGVYQEFKTFFVDSQRSIGQVVQDIERLSVYYTRIALSAEPTASLKVRFDRLVELEVNVAIPFLLEVYEDYERRLLTVEDFASILDLIEAFVIRRSVCDIATNVLNKMFLSFSRSVVKDNYRESVAAEFRLLTGTSRFPTDSEFHDALLRKDIYNSMSKRRLFILRRLINNPASEEVVLDSLTIEHIMPQNPNLSQEWRSELGEEWQRVQSTYLHTIGNLTLTGYNSVLGDKSFQTKLHGPNGFLTSSFQLNQDLKRYDQWDEAAIRDRAEMLADRAAHIWPFPKIGTDKLLKYRKNPSNLVSAEHHFPEDTPLKYLWQALRYDILEIDPIVTEEVFKTYIAYKADTNFVDVSPTGSALVLTLNIDFALLDDPRQLCRDVTNVGTHGNGDAQLRIAKIDDLPYALNLIRQAYALQTSAYSGAVAD